MLGSKLKQDSKLFYFEVRLLYHLSTGHQNAKSALFIRKKVGAPGKERDLQQ